MEREIKVLQEKATRDIDGARTLEELEEVRRRYLGRKGALAQFIKRLGTAPQEVRPLLGQQINRLREELENLYASRMRALEEEALQRRLAEETLDITLPGRRRKIGRLHILTRTVREIQEIFLRMGFEVVEGPEVEIELYNFERLNVPRDHPARDMQDTFYLEGNPDWLLRTHTTAVDVRVMEGRRPPMRVLSTGHCYRRDAPDASHSPMFHQADGFMVGEGVTFADLKGVLMTFAREFFGPQTRTRFRPSFFPFTEPSAEMEISCVFCGGKGCAVCGNGWLEILGCGMFHPRVLEMAGIDPERYTAFAFGMGVERPAMLKYGIDDIRLYFENDLRFLEQF
ncbi:MAG: phenylalanine--tRNA ligase subunit alpha [Armatimonadota bacterium]|nr:phenylalanine--tRNA ligase subunit alpha [Armatimonadota bacterium]MDR5702697.1 phenylalanine--tRNA ligase subunit alpha [Armatimonadota bacterium]MDR7433806.1 phenylalanine--tRNA ligase subunit alpha [Armatimonadota bacterium]